MMKRSNKSTIGIDEVNENLWRNRFSEQNIGEALKLSSLAKRADYRKGVAYAELNIAALNFYISENEAAAEHLSAALSWFEQNKNEKGYVRALLLRGNLYESLGDYEKTLSLWLEAYKSSLGNDDKESEGEACNQLGLLYSRLSNFPKALEFFNKSLKIKEELGDEPGVASSFNRIGMVFRQTKRYDDALEYYYKSLQLRRNSNQVSAIPWTLLGIANTFEEMKRDTEAIEYYELGMAGSDKRCDTQCMLGAGRVYSRTGRRILAEERLQQSLVMATELKSLALIAEANLALADHYELFSEPEKALKYFKEYFTSRESLQSSEVQNRISSIEVSHAIEKSEQEKEIYRLRHVELKQAYDIIEDKNNSIIASINYASRIQNAILPEPSEIRGLAGRLFIVYLPKDIVSGDFYWFSRIKNKLVIAAADCTGHGVPGALMSMLGISLLEDIVNARGISESGLILDELRNGIQKALHQSGALQEQKDGMDIELCVIDRKENTLQFSGAYNNLYLVSNGILVEYEADRMPIGIFERSDVNFKTNIIQVTGGEMIYMFSDGFADQFGGPNNKKFRYSKFKELLCSVSTHSLKTQKKILEQNFQDWKGDNTQIDDVLILGYRL